MKAQDLRVGNLIQLFGKGYYKIHVVSKTVIQVEGKLIGGETFDFKSLSPIPLTPEWLERAGFEKKENIRWYDSADLVSYILEGNGFYMNNVLQEIKYVHTLQNLYHALTCKELEFNLDNLNK